MRNFISTFMRLWKWKKIVKFILLCYLLFLFMVLNKNKTYDGVLTLKNNKDNLVSVYEEGKISVNHNTFCEYYERK